MNADVPLTCTHRHPLPSLARLVGRNSHPENSEEDAEGGSDHGNRQGLEMLPLPRFTLPTRPCPIRQPRSSLPSAVRPSPPARPRPRLSFLVLVLCSVPTAVRRGRCRRRPPGKESAGPRAASCSAVHGVRDRLSSRHNPERLTAPPPALAVSSCPAADSQPVASRILRDASAGLTPPTSPSRSRSPAHPRPAL